MVAIFFIVGRLMLSGATPWKVGANSDQNLTPIGQLSMDDENIQTDSFNERSPDGVMNLGASSDPISLASPCSASIRFLDTVFPLKENSNQVRN